MHSRSILVRKYFNKALIVMILCDFLFVGTNEVINNLNRTMGTHYQLFKIFKL